MWQQRRDAEAERAEGEARSSTGRFVTADRAARGYLRRSASKLRSPSLGHTSHAVSEGRAAALSSTAEGPPVTTAGPPHQAGCRPDIHAGAVGGRGLDALTAGQQRGQTKPEDRGDRLRALGERERTRLDGVTGEGAPLRPPDPRARTPASSRLLGGPGPARPCGHGHYQDSGQSGPETLTPAQGVRELRPSGPDTVPCGDHRGKSRPSCHSTVPLSPLRDSSASTVASGLELSAGDYGPDQVLRH